MKTAGGTRCTVGVGSTVGVGEGVGDGDGIGGSSSGGVEPPPPDGGGVGELVTVGVAVGVAVGVFVGVAVTVGVFIGVGFVHSRFEVSPPQGWHSVLPQAVAVRVVATNSATTIGMMNRTR